MDVTSENIGRPSFVARIAGVSIPSVIGWKGRIPVNRCPAIEAGTQGKHACESMRSDVVWVRIPDDAWPWHPRGRPLLDMTREVVERMSSASASELRT